MARRKTPRSDQSSIKYRFNPQEGPFFEVADFELEDYASHPSHDNKQSSRKSESMSYKVVSTAEFISAVGQIWSCANYSLGVFQRKENMRSEGNGGPPSSSKGQYVSPNLMAASDSPPMVHNLECINVTQKISFFEPPRGNCKHSLFGRFLEGGSNMSSGTLKGTGLVNVGVSYDLENMYGWMSEKTLAGLRHLVGSTQIAKKQSGESSVFQDTSSPSSCCLTGATIAHANKSVTECTDSKDSSSGQTMRPIMNTSAAITSLCSDYFLEPVQEIEVNGSISRKMSSGLHEDYHVSSLALGSCALGDHENKRNEENEFIIEDEANMEICSSIRDHENKRNEENEFIIDDEANMEICSSIRVKPRHALAKQEHAFAGAFAGVFVSMCLHPVDTIKTVVQSCHADQKSIGYISRSIISERGVTGLYRGITSNIASSAPISAVYTFTYESVKGALLPLFPKEYYSFAHCVAGGCASIATSFIFTPSERIKQQLQVGSHYQNCWNALVGIIERGGLSSLYAGWGAVLCRNVPHSIIKFYTYESLKQLIVSSQPPNAQPNTLQTLVCGGLAGSTAALFTTPFDVVKTRLQTQIPGSVSRYDGVFNTLKGIAKHEGLRGLYRGLTPRLVMYMTQGALFFASYETFKRLLSSDVPLLNAQTIQYEKDMEDDSTLSSSLPSS